MHIRGNLKAISFLLYSHFYLEIKCLPFSSHLFQLIVLLIRSCTFSKIKIKL